jgi:hypothetical protein
LDFVKTGFFELVDIVSVECSGLVDGFAQLPCGYVPAERARSFGVGNSVSDSG